ncbi:DUF4097 family beta strand repeat-containing protein [Lactobacillaceae bacterium Scapto_B20]
MKKLLISGIVVLALGLIAILIGGLSGGLNANSFNFENPNDVRLKSTQTKVVQSFKQINVATKATVTVKPGDQFKVVSQMPRGVQIHINVDNDQLNIAQSGKSDIVQYLGQFKIGQDIDDNLNGKVVVYVPNHHQLTQITQTNQNHFLNLERISIKNPLSLHGELYLTHVTAPSVKLTGASNDIDIDNSHFTAGISSVESTSGDVEIDKSNFQKLTKVHSENGDSEVTNTKVAKGSTEISSANGDVETNHSQFNKLKLSSDNGDVDFNALTIGKAFEASSDSGDVSGKLIANDQVHIKASSDNGDVDVKRSINHPNAIKQYSFYSSNGDVEIE